MNKRFADEIQEFIYKGEKTPFSIGTIVVCFLCLLLIIVATFTQINVTYTIPYFEITGELAFKNVSNPYVPQIPVILFVAAILGPSFALFTMLMYIIIGFFIWPVFALGGGLDYVKSGLFGYILGYIIAAIPTGKLLEKKYSLKHMFLATILGVFIIHICGLLYCLLLAILKIINFSHVAFALQAIGGIKTLYDIIFGFIFLILALPAKMILWIPMKSSYTVKRKQNKQE